jgi:hypothetical protein
MLVFRMFFKITFYKKKIYILINIFIVVVAGCTLAGVLALLAASVCWYT